MLPTKILGTHLTSQIKQTPHLINPLLLLHKRSIVEIRQIDLGVSTNPNPGQADIPQRDSVFEQPFRSPGALALVNAYAQVDETHVLTGVSSGVAFRPGEGSSAFVCASYPARVCCAYVQWLS